MPRVWNCGSAADTPITVPPRSEKINKKWDTSRVEHDHSPVRLAAPYDGGEWPVNDGFFRSGRDDGVEQDFNHRWTQIKRGEEENPNQRRDAENTENQRQINNFAFLRVLRDSAFNLVPVYASAAFADDLIRVHLWLN